jgi:hypothetical protein
MDLAEVSMPAQNPILTLLVIGHAKAKLIS